MIGIKLSGGIGNQMFQYAFVSTINEKGLFFLEKEGAPIELYEYFTLRNNIFYIIDKLFFNHNGYSLFFSHHLRGFFYSVVKKKCISKTVKISNEEKPLIQNNKFNNILFEGYFQSPLYFQKHQNEVFKAFKLKKHIVKEYEDQYQFLNKKSNRVVVHIRKSDYLDLGHLNLGGTDLSIPLSYYHQLIKKIHNNNNFYIFISDEPNLIFTEFDYLEKIYISTDKAIIDFQHMLNADTCLIANSTFSWWAAYLNKNPDKIIYCPQNFLGFKIGREYPVNIYPQHWIQVAVL